MAHRLGISRPLAEAQEDVQADMSVALTQNEAHAPKPSLHGQAGASARLEGPAQSWVSRPAEQRRAGSPGGQSGGGSPGAMLCP